MESRKRIRSIKREFKLRKKKKEFKENVKEIALILSLSIVCYGLIWLLYAIAYVI